ncbi:MAG TPA: DUF4105 domain-containing protein [Gemmatimonadaceae bacterium]
MRPVFALGLALLLAGNVGAQGQGTGNRERGTEVPRSSGSQFPVPGSQHAEPGSDLTIYLVTMGNGTRIWERFGHNAIRIVDATNRTDSVYNWGTFDFAQPHFLRRFMTGNTLYWMQGDDMPRTLEVYQYTNRSVWAQELDLTPAERLAVRDFIVWNARPENRYYRYDYYLDNCSTRVRDLIDRVVGGQVKQAMASHLTNTTYRFHTQRSFQFDPAVALGTNIGLGEVADRRINEWEESFLPARLMDHIRDVRIRDSNGAVHPLVKAEQQLFRANGPPEPRQPPDEMVRNLAIGLAVAVLLGVLARGASAGKRAARIGFATLATIWTAANGILGVILIVGWTATRHVFMARNENLLQFDVLSLALAVVLPLAVARARAVRLARTLSIVVAAVAFVGFAMQILPWFKQVNGEVIALTLPAHLALAWCVLALTLAPETAPARRAAAVQPVASRSAA